MPEDGAAVLDVADVSVNADISAEEPSQSTDAVEPKEKPEHEQQDGRKQPDALKKKLADMRRKAELIADPIEKKEALDDIKSRYDLAGKLRGYEEQWGTPREAAEVKSFLDSMGGRDAVIKMQSLISEVEQIDAKLAAGDPSVIDRMWQEAPEGMPKLIPGLLDKFAQTKPQEYEQFIAPRSIGYLDQAGFPQAFDRMVKLYEGGNTLQAQEIRDELIRWVTGNRQAAQQQKQVDPEVERLRAELAKREQGEESAKVNTAYNSVIDHAGPAIDAILKPMVAKLGLTAEGYKALRNDVWSHLQDARNSDATYNTVAPAKQRQGYDAWTEYAKRWTQDNADASARVIVRARYGHQLQNGAKTQPQQVTKAPGAPQIQAGKEPLPSEIDYSFKGKQTAQKAGFKSLEDMILSGQAPLKAGGIRKWR